MNFSAKIVIAVLVGVVTALSPVQAQEKEKKLKKSELPPAVQKTVDEQSKGATIRGFSTEVEDGKRIYEAEMVVNGHGKDISMDENGNVIEVEEEVSMDSLPAAVQEGLKKAAQGATIGKIESVTKNGKLEYYEAVVKKGAKRSEIQIGLDGKKLSPR